MRALGLASALLGIGSCTESPALLTELVVVVDSDLAVPGALDEIRVRATGPDGDTQSAGASLGEGESPLPRSLVLHHEGGALGTFAVSVEGLHNGTSVLVRAAQVSFLSGKSLVLPLHLVSACVGQECAEGETCTEQGCQPVAIDAQQLSPWQGEKPRLDGSSVPVGDGGSEPEPDLDGGEADAGDDSGVDRSDASLEPEAGQADAGADAAAPDATMCMPRQEQCNRADDDCDGRIDNGFDLSADPANCGTCGVRCNERRGEVCCRGACSRTCQ